MQLQKANSELKKQFLCVPPYTCVNGLFIEELCETILCGKDPSLKIKGSVNLPYQRAFQHEYRYKKCKIFEPFLPAIEFATYDAVDGNWICAYLTFLPIIEAVLRKWAEEEPSLTFNKMKGFAPELIKHLQAHPYFTDDRVNWTNSHIDYLQYILCDVLYQDFDGYSNKSFSEVFNRNLTLHKLDGVMNIAEGLSNVTRIMLVLDIIAELYLMKTPIEYWNNTFHSEPEKNTDFMLRWKLYVKRSMLAIGPNDRLIVQNAFINQTDETAKNAIIAKLNLDIELISKVH